MSDNQEGRVYARVSWPRAVGLVAGFIGTVAGIAGVLITTSRPQPFEISLGEASVVMRSDLELTSTRFRADLESLRAQVAAIQKAIAEGAEPSADAAVTLKIDAIEARLDELAEKTTLVEVIERAVSDNAERAMSIPLLRRDIDGLQQDVASAIVSNQAAIDRWYDMSKWFLGLIATIAIGLLGTGLAGLRKGKE